MSKIKASKLLSQFIREIAQEAVIPLEDAGTDTGIRMATRAEALARKMWQIAQGYDEHLDSGKIKKHAPDKAMITIILDRLEGRVLAVDVKDQKRKATVADRVSEQSKERINALAKRTGNNS